MSLLKIFKNERKAEVFNKLDISRLPRHVAIIMDGNGRWAKKRHMPRNIGHKEGANALKRTVIIAEQLGIKYLTVFAFSTENWKRPKEEIEYLMSLLSEMLDSFEKEFDGRDIRIMHIGDITKLSNELQVKINKIEKTTKKNKGLVFIVAMNYGSRTELSNCARIIAEKAIKGEIKTEEISPDTVAKHLYTKDIPDPELIIRTSGEKRLSNFLLWQSAYSEFYFDNILWPDYKKENFIKALIAFQNRERRYGGL